MKKEASPLAVRRVRTQFDAWRQGRKQGQRIPKELWEAAVKAAKQHGLNQVSQELGLDYSHLKQRVAAEGKRKAATASGELFVEVASKGAEESACVVELEKGNGAKLRVCVRDAATVDWLQLKEAFLGA